MATIKIRKGDTVKVIAGEDKGKQGRVLEVHRDKNRVLVEGVRMIKRHTRPNPQRQIKGGIAEKEASIHVSNVMVLSNGKVSRIGYKTEGSGDGARKVRVAKKTGETLAGKK
ncbi:MAG: 50S ribosomal protein L24 [Acidobacteria bacterium]|nr:50S ribosomal protein L24 [Acidobacteriota bacterium]